MYMAVSGVRSADVRGNLNRRLIGRGLSYDDSQARLQELFLSVKALPRILIEAQALLAMGKDARRLVSA